MPAGRFDDIMPARIISLAEWKAAHPPVLIFWQHGLQCALAWQRLWLQVLFSGKPVKR